MQNFTPEFCVKRYIDVKCIRDASTMSNIVKIRELKQAYGRTSVINWIKIWLIDISRIMNFEIDDYQATQTSIEIYDILYMLNIAELNLFFRKLRNGDYGIFYGKFNIQTICIAANEYRKQRGIEISKMPTDLQKLTL